MKYLLGTVVGLLIASLVCVASTGAINTIDGLYAQRHINGNTQKTLYKTEQALLISRDPQERYELLWRYARSASQIPEFLSAEKSEKLAIFKKAQTHAEEARQLFPKKTEALYWGAVCKGRYAEMKGILKSLRSIKPVRDTMEEILVLDSNFHRAHFVLSRVYRKAPKFISIGDPNRAEGHINKALEGDPNESLYLLEKARVLVKLKRKKEARIVLEKLLNLL